MKIKTQKNNPILRLIQEAKPIAGYLTLGALLSVASVVCFVAAPKTLGELVQILYDYWEAGSQGEILPALLGGAVFLGGLYLLGSLFQYCNMQLMNRVVSTHYTCNIRIKISDKLRFLPVKYVDQTSVGDVLSRMTGDVSEVGSYIHQIFDVLVQGMFKIILICVAMFSQNPVLALFVVLLTPVSMFLSAKIAAVSEKHYDAQFAAQGELTELVEESFSHFATCKAYNLEEMTQQKHAQINQRLRKAATDAGFTGGMVQPLIRFVNALSYILISLIGGWLIVSEGVSVGVVVTVVLYAAQFAAPLEEISMGFAGINHIKASAKRIFEILDMEEEPDQTGTITKKPEGAVVFEQVSFSYDPKEPLIENLSFQVQPGQKIAIVGPTGAGKTTIVNLLMRFYDVDSGIIRLDGTDIGQLQRQNLRSCFGMVLQDTWLFRGSIRENVAFGRKDATEEMVRHACEQAYCDHFIRTMPEGYDTIVGDDLANLSGGQKQLLTIARAFLADSPLLILDEATSNVDTRTEILVQKAMDALMEDRTCFVIAHRLSTIVNADRILVLHNGKIVEQGTHSALLAKRGFYYEMYMSQYAL